MSVRVLALLDLNVFSRNYRIVSNGRITCKRRACSADPRRSHSEMGVSKRNVSRTQVFSPDYPRPFCPVGRRRKRTLQIIPYLNWPSVHHERMIAGDLSPSSAYSQDTWRKIRLAFLRFEVTERVAGETLRIRRDFDTVNIVLVQRTAQDGSWRSIDV